MVTRYTVRAAFVVEVEDELALRDAAFKARRRHIVAQAFPETGNENEQSALTSLFQMLPGEFPGIRVVATTLRTEEPVEVDPASGAEPPEL